MAMIHVQCGLFGDGKLFDINVNRHAVVDILRKSIAKLLSTDNTKIRPQRLKLFLAQNVSRTWLRKGNEVEELLRNGNSVEFQRMRLNRAIAHYFPTSLVVEHVHVLVELTTPPTLQGRHLILDDHKCAVTKTMSVNPKNEIVFWEALRQDSTPIVAHTIITLPAQVYFLGNHKLGSQLYVRECYPKLWDLCNELTEESNLVILGNPGIGKTFFSYAILLYLARTNATVIYESGAHSRRYLFSHNMVVSGSQKDFDDFLDKKSTYYIIDAAVPVLRSAKTILLTVPDRSIWYDISKTCCTCRYMPVWSYQEIVKCQNAIYSNIPMPLLRNCFERWGGNPRYVLHYAEDRYQQQMLNEVVASIDLQSLLQFRDPRSSIMAHIIHLLLHYKVDGNFREVNCFFASEHIQQAVYNCLLSKNKRELFEFMGENNSGLLHLDRLRDSLIHVYSNPELFNLVPLYDANHKQKLRRLIKLEHSDDESDDDV